MGGEEADLELGQHRQTASARRDRERVRDRDAGAPHHEVTPLEQPRIVAAEHALDPRQLERARRRRQLGGRPAVAHPDLEAVAGEQARGGDPGARRAHDQRPGAGQRMAGVDGHWSL